MTILGFPPRGLSKTVIQTECQDCGCKTEIAMPQRAFRRIKPGELEVNVHCKAGESEEAQ